MSRIKNIILIIFSIGLFLNCLGREYVFAAVSKELKEAERMEAESRQKPSFLVRQKIEYKAEGLRDPFRGARIETASGTVEAKLPNFTVQGIVWGGSFPQAIINNKVVKIGDTLESAKVIDISKDGVTVFSGGQQYKFSSPAVGDLKKAEEKRKGGKDEKK
jgi:hypothetical protein